MYLNFQQNYFGSYLDVKKLSNHLFVSENFFINIIEKKNDSLKCVLYMYLLQNSSKRLSL